MAIIKNKKLNKALEKEIASELLKEFKKINSFNQAEEFLNKFTRIWDDFSSLSGVVTAAYGWRWRHEFGRDQIGELVKSLKQDPSNRQGVVLAWNPGGDGLGSKQKLNVPCPFGFTVNIIGGKLNLHNLVRSNDMILGFPHDVAGFALLQRILAGHFSPISP